MSAFHYPEDIANLRKNTETAKSQKNNKFVDFSDDSYLCCMIDIQAYKGIAPGKIIAHCLKERDLSQKELAERTHCHAQTISAIVTGNRDIPQDLSFRLDKEFGFEDGFFMLVQAYYKIRIHTLKAQSIPHRVIPSIRRIVFWDIDMDSLDWQANKAFIIQRVLERGNENEIQQVKAYYETQDE